MRKLRNSMIVFATILFTFSAITTASAQASPTPDPKIEKKRQEIRKLSMDTLARLYKLQPAAKTAVQNAAGYAVFSNTGVKILVSGSGRGQGLAVNNKTGSEVFMKMFEIQAGLGFGVKKFKLIFIFDTQKAFDKFVNSGWEFGGEAGAAAKSGEGKGASVAGAVSVSEGVWAYQLTDKGIALEITAKGTKFYKDDPLNTK